MKPNHPGVYKCKDKDSKKLHWWIVHNDGTSHCRFCKIVLNKEQTKELDIS